MYGTEVLSFIFGAVLGVLLYSFYNPPVLHHGPNSRNIVGQIFEYQNKKYTLEPRICCAINTK